MSKYDYPRASKIEKIGIILFVIALATLGVTEIVHAKKEDALRAAEHTKRVGMVKILKNEDRPRSFWECEHGNFATLEHIESKYRFTTCGYFGNPGETFHYE